MPTKLGLSPEQIERCRRPGAPGRRRACARRPSSTRRWRPSARSCVCSASTAWTPTRSRFPTAWSSPSRRPASSPAGRGALDGQRPGAGSAASVAEAAALLADPEKAAALAEHPRWREAVAPARRGDARADPRQPGRARAPAGLAPPGRAPAALRHRRHRQHPRGRRPGRGRRPRRRPVHRGHPLDGAVAARPRALRRDDVRASAARSPPRRTSASCARRSTPSSPRSAATCAW